MATGDVAVDRTSLLEKCVTQFRNYAQYKNDIRFLRICLKYVIFNKSQYF